MNLQINTQAKKTIYSQSQKKFVVFQSKSSKNISTNFFTEGNMVFFRQSQLASGYVFVNDIEKDKDLHESIENKKSLAQYVGNMQKIWDKFSPQSKSLEQMKQFKPDVEYNFLQTRLGNQFENIMYAQNVRGVCEYMTSNALKNQSLQQSTQSDTSQKSIQQYHMENKKNNADLLSNHEIEEIITKSEYPATHIVKITNLSSQPSVENPSSEKQATFVQSRKQYQEMHSQSKKQKSDYNWGYREKLIQLYDTLSNNKMKFSDITSEISQSRIGMLSLDMNHEKQFLTSKMVNQIFPTHKQTNGALLLANIYKDNPEHYQKGQTMWGYANNANDDIFKLSKSTDPDEVFELLKYKNQIINKIVQEKKQTHPATVVELHDKQGNDKLTHLYKSDNDVLKWARQKLMQKLVQDRVTGEFTPLFDYMMYWLHKFTDESQFINLFQDLLVVHFIYLHHTVFKINHSKTQAFLEGFAKNTMKIAYSAIRNTLETVQLNQQQEKSTVSSKSKLILNLPQRQICKEEIVAQIEQKSKELRNLMGSLISLYNQKHNMPNMNYDQIGEVFMKHMRNFNDEELVLFVDRIDLQGNNSQLIIDLNKVFGENHLGWKSLEVMGVKPDNFSTSELKEAITILENLSESMVMPLTVKALEMFAKIFNANKNDVIKDSFTDAGAYYLGLLFKHFIKIKSDQGNPQNIKKALDNILELSNQKAFLKTIRGISQKDYVDIFCINGKFQKHQQLFETFIKDTDVDQTTLEYLDSVEVDGTFNSSVSLIGLLKSKNKFIDVAIVTFFQYRVKLSITQFYSLVVKLKNIPSDAPYDDFQTELYTLKEYSQIENLIDNYTKQDQSNTKSINQDVSKLIQEWVDKNKGGFKQTLKEFQMPTDLTYQYSLRNKKCSPYPWQKDIVKTMLYYNYQKDKNSIMQICIPPGHGKTIIITLFAEYVRQKQEKLLILTFNGTLSQQMKEYIDRDVYDDSVSMKPPIQQTYAKSDVFITEFKKIKKMLQSDIFSNFVLIIDEYDRLTKDNTAFVDIMKDNKNQEHFRLASDYSFLAKFKSVILMTGTYSSSSYEPLDIMYSDYMKLAPLIIPSLRNESISSNWDTLDRWEKPQEILDKAVSIIKKNRSQPWIFLGDNTKLNNGNLLFDELARRITDIGSKIKVHQIDNWSSDQYIKIKGIITEISDKEKDIVILMTKDGSRGISMDNKAAHTGVITTFMPDDMTDLDQQLNRGARGLKQSATGYMLYDIKQCQFDSVSAVLLSRKAASNQINEGTKEKLRLLKIFETYWVTTEQQSKLDIFKDIFNDKDQSIYYDQSPGYYQAQSNWENVMTSLQHDGKLDHEEESLVDAKYYWDLKVQNKKDYELHEDVITNKLTTEQKEAYKKFRSDN